MNTVMKMRAKLFQEQKIKAQDNRIDNSKHIEDLLKSEGWKLIEKRLSDMREEAHYHILSVDVESKWWRSRLHAFDEILGIPQEFLLIGKVAKSEEL